MYRTNNFGWKLTHVLSILAHLGLIVSAGIAYIYNMAKDTQAAETSNVIMADSVPCTLAIMRGLGNWGSMDMLLHTLLVSCISVGILGLIVTIVLFYILLAVEPTKVALTEGEQHWRRQVVTFFSCIFNVILAGAGLGLAVALGIKVMSSKSLITPLAWAAIQAPICLVTALYDAIKNRRDGKDLLD
ncbi:hypothetical protein B0H66DRAFT_323828 [Apodospora peruviana]|uniref:DUF2975 domain-containing protein n=1 Tax=Apodospora peruviana TaxID=516989 RepID=A0AAE0M0R6_9PEZI|nr:hypothetical protein B0H66DRAFT_323828 [Apodospora peruviana]